MKPNDRMDRVRSRAWLWYLVASGILTVGLPAGPGSQRAAAR